MHARATAFANQARERYEFEPQIEEFPEGTKTAAAAAEAVGCDVGQIASSLVFDVDGSLVVSVTSGANRVDERALAERFDADAVEMAGPERIKTELGWSIGGVPPFCHDRSVPVLVDESLLEHDTVWAAAGTPEAVFPIDPETLVTFADGEPASIAD
ncbi:YbaK/EbsC family protein [Natrarchaeobius oligotrophus]|uniref:YbaK/EbsC family protein n=1 Tax=Natrarchaeobius chitinivorans TaxID=1679083 RepID=A0A3N6MP87_NATCH|nr:YbaK/EbsC family protein [Natrarchaeobius chitinivorans]RQH03525.1 YbaK/EbsC family protein [Natrarchaeobius chitinivorans]